MRPPSDLARRRGLLLAGALLFAAVFALRVAVEDPSQTVTLLFALPIALVAVEFGASWGLAAAALALGLFGLWDYVWEPAYHHDVTDYLTRAAVFFVIGGMVGALADRLRRVSAAAEAAREEAERANHEKSEFLSRMSHELRTPLNAILGFGQLLELEELEAGQRESVGQIIKGGRHLLELINEVLDIARIEAGTMTLSIEPVHLGSVLAETLSLIGPLAAEAEVRLDADPSKLGDQYVLADQQRLKQVLLNVLSNAVKYNHEGGSVTVGYERLPEGRVRLAVSDTGPGIGPDLLKDLFTPFQRLGADRTDIEGTGLGLALSKRLMEAMGGTITAESQLGVGTTVSLELADSEETMIEPSAGDGAAAERADDVARPRRSVLYIEDNPSNLRLVERALEHLPHVRLISAMHGNLGLELARQHRPDLVLLDLHLPDLTGREVLERLQADPATEAIPVVVLSADATANQIELLLKDGAADYLTKPVDLPRLLEIVSKAG